MNYEIRFREEADFFCVSPAVSADEFLEELFSIRYSLLKAEIESLIAWPRVAEFHIVPTSTRKMDWHLGQVP